MISPNKRRTALAYSAAFMALGGQLVLLPAAPAVVPATLGAAVLIAALGVARAWQGLRWWIGLCLLTAAGGLLSIVFEEAVWLVASGAGAYGVLFLLLREAGKLPETGLHRWAGLAAFGGAWIVGRAFNDSVGALAPLVVSLLFLGWATSRGAEQESGGV